MNYGIKVIIQLVIFPSPTMSLFYEEWKQSFCIEIDFSRIRVYNPTLSYILVFLMCSFIHLKHIKIYSQSDDRSFKTYIAMVKMAIHLLSRKIT